MDYIGSLQPDKQFKDGTSKFTELISNLISFQEGDITIEAPAINMTTNKLIEKSKIPLSILFVHILVIQGTFLVVNVEVAINIYL